MTIIIFTVGDAIRKINPSAHYELTSDGRIDDVDSATIEWLEGTTPISKEDIKSALVELKTEHDAQDYARKRQGEYPSIQELVVALYDTDDKSAIEAKRAEVKAKYPK
jgi:hypothetical protein